jgi:hypothetical protein
MEELRVPQVELSVEVILVDERSLRGVIFVPPAAAQHSGPTRPEEWLNDPASFFPFLADGEERPVLLNKHELAAMRVPAQANEEPLPEGVELPSKRVAVACRGRRFEGVLVLDGPAGERVLDHMNHHEAFVTLREGERHTIVQKNRITRVVELDG